MSGPRAYGVGTVRALYRVSVGTCAKPTCVKPVLVFDDGKWLSNVHIAHIRGAEPGSARYDASMSDPERAAFDNLLLLCPAHHDLIDKINPSEYSVELLEQWKRDSEDGTRTAPAAGITEGQLNDAIDRILAKLSTTQFEISVAILGGLVDGDGAHTLPLEAFFEILARNTHLASVGKVFDVVIHNSGPAAVTVSSVTLLLKAGIENSYSRSPELSQPLPARLEGYDELHWTILFSDIDSKLRMLATFAPGDVGVVARVHLGTGSSVDSAFVRWPL